MLADVQRRLLVPLAITVYPSPLFFPSAHCLLLYVHSISIHYFSNLCLLVPELSSHRNLTLLPLSPLLLSSFSQFLLPLPLSFPLCSLPPSLPQLLRQSSPTRTRWRTWSSTVSWLTTIARTPIRSTLARARWSTSLRNTTLVSQSRYPTPYTRLRTDVSRHTV